MASVFVLNLYSLLPLLKVWTVANTFDVYYVPDLFICFGYIHSFYGNESPPGSSEVWFVAPILVMN